MRKFSTASISLAAAGLLVVGIAGVGASAANADTATNAAPAHVATATSTKIPGPLAAVPEVFGGNTAVALDSGFTDALTTLGLTPSTYGTATLTDGSLHFPITGGSVAYWDPKAKYRPYVQGVLEHDGSGLNLTAGDTTVTLSNFTVNPGNSKLYGDVSVNGQVAATQAFIFELHGKTLKPLSMDGNNAILTGTTVHISADAAGLLNQTFKTDAVKEGLLVGVATITAQVAK